MRTSKPFVKNRNKLGASKPIFVPNLVAGNSLKDIISQTGSTTSISGARWGIVNGVVAQFAANQPRIEDEGFGACPAFTQLAKMTETLTDAVWLKNRCTVVQTLNFQGMSTWKIQEDTSNNYHIFSYSTPIQPDNSVFGLCFVAKRDGRSVGIGITLKTGLGVTAYFNLATGAIFSGTASYKSITPLGNGYFLCLVAHNIGTGTQSQNINIVPCTDAGVDSYQGDGVSGVIIAQPTIINFGVNGIPFIPPYVPNNTTSSVSVVSEAGNTSFDLDLATLSRLKTGLRGPNAQGHIELEFESNVDSGWLPTTFFQNLFTTANSNATGSIYVLKDAAGLMHIRFFDGTNFANVDVPPITIGQTFKISIDYGTYTDGTQKMRLTVNGVKSSVVAFSGSFGAQDMRFFFGNTIHAGWIKKDSLKYYEKPRW